MKYIIHSILLLILIGFTACEKVIDLKLDDNEDRLVIEGILDEGEFPLIQLTKTTDFYNPSLPEGVSGASVQLSDNQGNSWQLEETEASGLYTHPTLTGTINTTYTLQVTVDGIIYTATSKLLPPQLEVEFESTESDFQFGNENLLDIEMQFDDDADNERYFRVIVSNSEEIIDEYHLSETGDIKIRNAFEAGEQAQIQLICIDEPIYEYYHALREITNGGGPSANPYNPQSNWDNGALGYFAARSISRFEFTVQAPR